MPFNRPTPQDIRDRLAVEVEAVIPGADAKLRRTVEDVLVRMMALSSHELHGHLAYISDQILPDTAEAENLERHAAIWGVTRTAGANATGAVVFTGENGVIIPLETQLRRGDGILYKTTATATVAAGTVTLQTEALSSGEIANAAIGGTLIMVTPISGLSSSGAITDDGNGGGLTGGLDNEDDTGLRARVITRIQQPPHGGAKHDYEAWAKEVAGVTRVWVYPEQLGLGTVWVTFVMDNKTPSIIPDAADVTAVSDIIAINRPVTADITVAAPTPVALDLTLAISPDTADIRAAIEAELADFLIRDGVPGGTLKHSRLSEAISLAAGEFSHDLTSPAADVTYGFGELPVLGTITWVGS